MAKIMLVEDDNNLREIYEARLLAEGYEIISAADGEAALAMAVKEKPDLIISDVMMPKISGFDMLDLLRTTPETKDVKVIMMTALSQAEDQGRAEKLGADRYLVKSQVTLEDVAKVAREVLGGDAPAPAPAATETPAAATPAPPPVNEPATVAAPIPVTATADDPTPVAGTPVEPPVADSVTPAPVLANDPPAETPAVAPAAQAAATTADTTADTSTAIQDKIESFEQQPAPAPAEVPAGAPAAIADPVPATAPAIDQPAPDPVNQASTDAAELANTTNELMQTAASSAEPTAPSQHGRVVQPLNDLSTPPETPPAPTTPPNVTLPPDATPPAAAPQPGNVIQPGIDPNQIAL
jgi:CheY-like chemotaxis protein